MILPVGAHQPGAGAKMADNLRSRGRAPAYFNHCCFLLTTLALTPTDIRHRHRHRGGMSKNTATDRVATSCHCNNTNLSNSYDLQLNISTAINYTLPNRLLGRPITYIRHHVRARWRARRSFLAYLLTCIEWQSFHVESLCSHCVLEAHRNAVSTNQLYKTTFYYKIHIHTHNLNTKIHFSSNRK